jgi:hypothetical protein
VIHPQSIMHSMVVCRDTRCSRSSARRHARADRLRPGVPSASIGRRRARLERCRR